MRPGALAVFVSFLVAAFTTASPAAAAYLYLDSNGDGLSGARQGAIGDYATQYDCLFSASTTVDVYIVTDQEIDGAASECGSGEDFTISSYELLLRIGGPGVVDVQGWTDHMGFNEATISAGDGMIARSGNDLWIGRAGSTHPPGKYKIGTLTVEVTGNPYIDFLARSDPFTEGKTGFASACSGQSVPGWVVFNGLEIRLSDVFGTCYPDPVVPSTWGKIKNRYR